MSLSTNSVQNVQHCCMRFKASSWHEGSRIAHAPQGQKVWYNPKSPIAERCDVSNKAWNSRVSCPSGPEDTAPMYSMAFCPVESFRVFLRLWTHMVLLNVTMFYGLGSLLIYLCSIDYICKYNIHTLASTHSNIIHTYVYIYIQLFAYQSYIKKSSITITYTYKYLWVNWFFHLWYNKTQLKRLKCNYKKWVDWKVKAKGPNKYVLKLYQSFVHKRSKRLPLARVMACFKLPLLDLWMSLSSLSKSVIPTSNKEICRNKWKPYHNPTPIQVCEWMFFIQSRVHLSYIDPESLEAENQATHAVLWWQFAEQGCEPEIR